MTKRSPWRTRGGRPVSTSSGNFALTRGDFERFARDAAESFRALKRAFSKPAKRRYMRSLIRLARASGSGTLEASRRWRATLTPKDLRRARYYRRCWRLDHPGQTIPRVTRAAFLGLEV